MAPLVCSGLVPRCLLRAPCLVAVLWASACGGDATEGRLPRARPAADKAALFGDPSLVPTREGERIRRDIATAQEIEAALAILSSVDRVRVDVERDAGSPARVLAVIDARPEARSAELEPRVAGVVRTVAGPEATAEIIVEPSPAAAAPPRGPSWPLLLGVLGLGFFGGVLLERIHRLRSVHAARRGR